MSHAPTSLCPRLESDTRICIDAELKSSVPDSALVSDFMYFFSSKLLLKTVYKCLQK